MKHHVYAKSILIGLLLTSVVWILPSTGSARVNHDRGKTEKVNAFVRRNLISNRYDPSDSTQ